MATSWYRVPGILKLCACLACSSAAAPQQDVQRIRDRGAGDGDSFDAAPADAAPPEPDFAAQWREAPLFRSGTRLRARVIEGGGDARVLSGFHDAALAVDCAYELAEDGVHRCLPRIDVSWVDYLDPQCTEAVWRSYPRDGGCEEPATPFALEGLPPAGACSEAFRTRVYRIGAPRPTATVYTAGSDGCTAIAAPSCVRSVELVRPEQFVRGHSQLEPVSDELALRWIEYDDGARYVQTLFDAKREVDCAAEPDFAHGLCIPTSTAHVFLDGAHGTAAQYAGTSCSGTRAALDFSRAPCTPAAIALEWKPLQCQRYEYALFELGPELAAVYEQNETGCSEVRSAPGSWFFELGPHLDLDSLPALLRARAGSGRLRVHYYASATGRPLQAPRYFFDLQLNRECQAQRMADDTLRCAPFGVDAAIDPRGPFAEAQCTRPLIGVRAATDGCPRVPQLAVRDAPPTNRAAAYYEVGSRFQPEDETVYFAEGGACRAQPTAAGEAYYELRPKLELAIVRERVE